MLILCARNVRLFVFLKRILQLFVIIKISWRACLKLIHTSNLSEKEKKQWCQDLRVTLRKKEVICLGLISHVMYQRSCVKKRCTFNATWKAFSASTSLNVVKQQLTKMKGSQTSQRLQRDLQLLFSTQLFIKKSSLKKKGWLQQLRREC